jgi:transcriptional regulator with XRE-family HTH domain
MSLTQTEFADKLNISRVTLSEIERGKTKVNSDILTNLVNTFNVLSEWLITGKGEMMLAAPEELLPVLDDINKRITIAGPILDRLLIKNGAPNLFRELIEIMGNIEMVQRYFSHYFLKVDIESSIMSYREKRIMVNELNNELKKYIEINQALLSCLEPYKLMIKELANKLDEFDSNRDDIYSLKDKTPEQY